LQERDEVALRGRQAGVRLWAPLARDASARAARTGEGTRGRAGAAPVPD